MCEEKRDMISPKFNFTFDMNSAFSHQLRVFIFFVILSIKKIFPPRLNKKTKPFTALKIRQLCSVFVA